MPIFAEYIWVDGQKPTAHLRSKTKVIYENNVPKSTEVPLDSIDLSWFPVWGADGSSTKQADGADSDIILKPVAAVRDPFRKGHYLVMTEVFTGASGEPHPSNTRANLRKVLEAGADKTEALFGFEQEYTFLDPDTKRPLGFPESGFPEPQGKYYCGVGAGKITGRPIYEGFMQHCLDAGLQISGVNWEVMPGQAEVQIGPVSGLDGGDHIWFARWILERTGEEYGAEVTFDAKPAKGDWNGAGMHTNFSTKAMREEGGMAAIEKACEAIGKKVQEHLAEYGYGYEERLTGAHETAHYSQFKYGVSDRTASIRIPRAVADEGKGYLEDRRPNANADPYRIAARMLATVCDIEI